ncbi:aryl-sulfate sulfotransferase [Eudoraea chungangensis]|uniref:aryl-sulfate sulfotransferase n=1 Tax=Eudoraea chungangensis TaxID=1481905 RepID=UPI0023EDA166|nr:aryl-sulfate sulfotransferase [Eudoraea chungangensis]
MSLKTIPFTWYSLILALLILSSCGSQLEYSIDSTLNPYKISPLTALVTVDADKPCNATIKVLGNNPIEHSFNLNSKKLEIPVLGLYPDRLNKVAITLDFEGGQVLDTIEIKTEKTPSYFPDIKINKINRDKMAPGIHACDIHFANNGKFKSGPLFFDDEGEVRWYLDLSFAGKMVSPFQRLKDGTILMVSRHVIYEFDMLGKLLKETEIDNNFGMHHDVVELPDGNLLICVGIRRQFIRLDDKMVQSDSDFVMVFNRKESKIVKVWDLGKNLDVSRNELNFFRPGDWLHMNGLAFDDKDNSIIVSGKNQGLIKLSWKDSLQWIIAPNRKWGKSGRNGDGFETKSFLLTAVNSKGVAYPKNVQEGTESSESFDFPWGMHAPVILPNDNLLVFDNGTYRNYNNEVHYSRAVEYKINEADKTVEQVWQYGKQRGEEFFSTIIGDVDYLAEENNILITSGYLTRGAVLHGKIVEVDYATREEVFEASLYFKNENSTEVRNYGQTGNWGQTDILYRSERLELKF